MRRLIALLAIPCLFLMALLGGSPAHATTYTNHRNTISCSSSGPNGARDLVFDMYYQSATINSATYVWPRSRPLLNGGYTTWTITNTTLNAAMQVDEVRWMSSTNDLADALAIQNAIQHGWNVVQPYHATFNLLPNPQNGKYLSDGETADYRYVLVDVENKYADPFHVGINVLSHPSWTIIGNRMNNPGNWYCSGYPNPATDPIG